MPILRRNKKEYSFTQVDNKIPENKNLSWKAKGILIYLLSRPDNWEFNKSDIIKRATDGGHSTDSGLEELKKYGYLKIKKTKDKEGKFNGWIWIVNELPTRNPENPTFGKPEFRKTTPYTNKNNNNTNNIKNIKKEIIEYFFKRKGFDYSDKEFKIVSKSYKKTASNLLEISNLKEIKKAIDVLANWAESRDLDWTLKTVEKKWGAISNGSLKPKEEKKKPYFRGERMYKRKGKWFVIPNDGGDWKEFAGNKEDIEWK